jgi:hypothetical protein
MPSNSSIPARRTSGRSRKPPVRFQEEYSHVASCPEENSCSDCSLEETESTSSDDSDWTPARQQLDSHEAKRLSKKIPYLAFGNTLTGRKQGVYELMDDKVINGGCVWRNLDHQNDRYLYHSKRGEWMIGDREDMEGGESQGYWCLPCHSSTPISAQEEGGVSWLESNDSIDGWMELQDMGCWSLTTSQMALSRAKLKNQNRSFVGRSVPKGLSPFILKPFIAPSPVQDPLSTCEEKSPPGFDAACERHLSSGRMQAMISTAVEKAMAKNMKSLVSALKKGSTQYSDTSTTVFDGIGLGTHRAGPG